MEAVVLAAGEGRRMRPLSRRWPKALLPIDGRPVLATLLRELAAAGLADVTLVVGHLAGQVQALAGDGSAFGLSLRYALQPEPLGSADALRRALAAGARPPLLVSAADTLYAPGDVGAAAGRWLASGAAGGLGVRPALPDELPERSAVWVEGERVVAVVEKPPPGTAAGHAGAPLWLLDGELALSFLPGVDELAVAFQRAIAAGKRIVALELGPTRDLTRPEDVVTANFPYLWLKG